MHLFDLKPVKINSAHVLFATLVLVVVFLNACSDKDESPQAPSYVYKPISVHVSFGLPRDADTSDDYIINRAQYLVDYNPVLNVPNWVAWELNADWYGDVDRYSGNFITDTSLPAGMYRVTHKDYTNSGYDRGHMVRSEERTATVEDNKSTFILTNILPQTPDLNQGVWLNFEYFCEDLCKNQNKELFVYAGGVFNTRSKIGNGVTVPDSCFKIVVVLERGQGLKDVTGSTIVYSVMMPNIAGIRSDKWSQYAVSVDQIEAVTGYNFLNEVPQAVQAVIESKVNKLE